MVDSNLKKRVALGVILVILGVSFLINDFIVEQRERVFSKMNLELSELLANNDVNSNGTFPEESGVIEHIPEEVEQVNYQTYIGVLEIPKIAFSRGFYHKDSDLNNVKFNLKILPQSNYPDEEKGNVIIIGHSGNYSNSYFANLYQLAKGDNAIIQYKNKKYTYKIVNIYNEDKDGIITIYRDETKNCLTLITCTKDDDTKQTVYILELESIE